MYRFFGIYSAWCSLIFLDLWFGMCHYFEKFSIIITSSVFSVPSLFFLLQVFPLCICYRFSNCPIVLRYFVIYFSFLFFFACPFWKFLLTLPQAHYFFFQLFLIYHEGIKDILQFCNCGFDF